MRMGIWLILLSFDLPNYLFLAQESTKILLLQISIKHVLERCASEMMHSFPYLQEDPTFSQALNFATCFNDHLEENIMPRKHTV